MSVIIESRLKYGIEWEMERNRVKIEDDWLSDTILNTERG
jgi:hypothetical protein